MPKENISTYFEGVTENYEIECTFARTTLQHIDPVFHIVKKENDSIYATPLKCPVCFQIFDGPQRLKRHMTSCKSEECFQQLDLKPFVEKVGANDSSIVIIESDENEPLNVKPLILGNFQCGEKGFVDLCASTVQSSLVHPSYSTTNY